MIGYAISKNKVKIRLPEERWFHITESHDYLSGLSEITLDAINDPELIIQGEKDELIAAKKFKKKHVVIIYREITKEDGFIITSFMTSNISKLKKNRRIIWKKE